MSDPFDADAVLNAASHPETAQLSLRLAEVVRPFLDTTAGLTVDGPERVLERAMMAFAAVFFVLADIAKVDPSAAAEQLLDIQYASVSRMMLSGITPALTH